MMFHPFITVMSKDKKTSKNNMPQVPIPEAVIEMIKSINLNPEHIKFYKESKYGQLFYFDFQGLPTGKPWYIAYKDGKATEISYRDYPDVIYL